jgi:hypothetical protein
MGDISSSVLAFIQFSGTGAVEDRYLPTINAGAAMNGTHKHAFSSWHFFGVRRQDRARNRQIGRKTGLPISPSRAPLRVLVSWSGDFLVGTQLPNRMSSMALAVRR